MDILYLVDRLENLIATSRRMPLVNQIILKENDILNLVDQLRTTIPEEIKQARRILQDKERIIAQAQAEASALLARAREESAQAVNREGLLRNAEQRSRELVREAEVKGETLKNEADNYVLETLRALRDHLTEIETDIGRSILSIEKGLESLEGNQEEQTG
jgi:cell division septum initiation protein DivIVA